LPALALTQIAAPRALRGGRLIAQLGLVSAEAQRSELGLDTPLAAAAAAPEDEKAAPATADAPASEAPADEDAKKEQ
jgi:hypothetical protein